MRWIRRHIRPTTWLALLALSLQLAVSFGHAHPRDLGLAALSAGSTVESLISSDPAHAPAVPADRDHDSTSGDLCPICASINLAASLILPSPPQLAALAEIGRVRLSDVQASRLSNQARFSFQARAPPVV